MKRILSAAVLTLLAACSNATGPNARVQVATDQRVYALPAGNGPGVTVSFTVQNTSEQTVRLVPCGATATVFLEHREGSAWSEVGANACPLILYTGPLELAPGETVSGTVRTDRVSGTYRLRAQLDESIGGEHFATSPTFEVRWADG
ncbi:MAG TPA: hypothetical protein VFJ16_07425 [Longimicrobium sp.]|nr:hypothetical protein [Longimicrobium sp.]